MLLIFVLILVLFGGKRMPELARGLGKSLRDFKRARDGVEDQIKRALEDDPVPAKRAKKTPKIEPATTAPEDTTVYDEAAGAAGAAVAGTATAGAADGHNANADDSAESSGTAEVDEDYSRDDDSDAYLDPYEDEYIGGTAESDAGARGIGDEHSGETGEAKTTESAPEAPGPQDAGAADAEQPDRKKDAPDAGVADGGGI